MFNLANISMNYILVSLFVLKFTGDRFAGNWFVIVLMVLLSIPLSYYLLKFLIKVVPANYGEREDAFDAFEDKTVADGMRDIFTYSMCIYLSIVSTINFYKGDLYYIYDQYVLMAVLFTIATLSALLIVFIEYKRSEGENSASSK